MFIVSTVKALGTIGAVIFHKYLFPSSFQERLLLLAVCFLLLLFPFMVILSHENV